MKRPEYLICPLFMFCLVLAQAKAQAPLVQSPGGILEEEVRQAQSRLTAMSHGYYSREEWDQLFNHFARLLNRAEKKGRDGLVMQLSSSQALVQAQALGQNRQATALLEGVLNQYQNDSNPELRRIYVQLADLYADTGDEPAIARLIGQYRKSSLHDPEPFRYEGGKEPGDPLSITRPHAHGAESLTITAMENSRKRALLASGRLADNFTAEDVTGQMIELRNYRGQVVLLDFYHPQWPGWAKTLPHLKKVYQRFEKQGFEIIGIPLVTHAKPREKLPWILLKSSQEIAAKYRVFGDATNFLIDQDGRIAGRNLNPADLNLQLSELLKTEL